MVKMKTVNRILKTASLVIFSFLFTHEVSSQKLNQLEFNFTPTLAYRDFKGTSFDYSIGFRYDLGISYRKVLSKKITIGVGLGYSEMGYNLLNFHVPDTTIIQDIKAFRHFIELPLLLSYEFYKNENKHLFFDINFINQLYVGQVLKVSDNMENMNELTVTFSDLRKFNYDYHNIALQVGLSYLQNFENKLDFRISPFCKYGLFDLDDIHDMSFGVKLGLGYNF